MRLFFSYTIWLICLVWSIELQAQSCEKIYINGGQSWFPFFYQGAAEQKGIIGDIVIEASKRLDIRPVVISPTPWKRTLLLLSLGRIDVIAGVIKTEERARQFRFSDAITSTQLKIIVKKNQQFKFKTIKHLRNRRGLKIRGHSLGNKNDKYAQENLVIEEVHEASSIMKMLVAGRADYGIYEVHGAKRQINKMKLNSELTLLDQALTEEPIFVVFSKKSPCSWKAARFFQVFSDMKQDGTINKIIEFYRNIELEGMKNG